VENTPASEPSPPEWGAHSSTGAGRRLLHAASDVVQTLLIALVFFLLVNQVTARIRVDGASMEPTLHDGELVVVNRLAYLRHEPERGDIIVLRPPIDPQRRFIKRVIGIPGDTILVQNGEVFVNGILLHEPYIAEAPLYSGEWSVGPGEVFVLGDNRNNSADSQNWGNLDQDEIIGKAILIYWPPNQLGLIRHYDLMGGATQ
jgi:signal peptidase I